MNIKKYVTQKAQEAKAASKQLALLPTEMKNKALTLMAEALERQQDRLIRANSKDLSEAKRRRLSSAMLDRLTLTPQRIREMAAGLRTIAGLPDPVGEIMKAWSRPNGMKVGRMRMPLGVIGIIYESRPNVTADTASLCLKSGNAVVLRGGSEAIHSNATIAKLLSQAARSAGVPAGAITFIDKTDRRAVMELLKLDQYIDLIIPRGGEGLIRTVVENSKIPVIKHDKGVCHTYVDESADLAMAEAICFNAKVQRPATCNAMETLLVHEKIAPAFLPKMTKRFQAAGVEIRGCPKTRALLKQNGLAKGIKAARPSDWGAEYLGKILAVKVVKGLEEAMDHIARYGSHHSDAIVAQDRGRVRRFLREVDSCAVFANASTRLNDGYQFGLGAEIGISTTKIHARGPMGLEELTSAKFIVLGSGQLRE
jgi:glutamate-5-semialdehyde dehydrogenase